MWKSVLLLSSVIALSACNHHPTTHKATGESGSATAVTAQGFTGKQLRLIGRFDTSTQGKAQFTWPGSAVEFRFSGTSAAIALGSTGD
ncbi:MAG TPA: hypothetical protein VF433_15585, partial [Cellvibrio sp.]